MPICGSTLSIQDRGRTRIRTFTADLRRYHQRFDCTENRHGRFTDAIALPKRNSHRWTDRRFRESQMQFWSYQLSKSLRTPKSGDHEIRTLIRPKLKKLTFREIPLEFPTACLPNFQRKPAALATESERYKYRNQIATRSGSNRSESLVSHTSILHDDRESV